MTGDLVSDKIGDKITGISSHKSNKSKIIDELFQKHGKVPGTSRERSNTPKKRQQVIDVLR